jgi:hypothetical protein
MADSLLTLTDSLVESLATEFPVVEIDGVECPVTITWPIDPSVELKDEQLRDPLVWVIDFGETLEEEGDVTHEQFEVLIVVQMKLPAGEDEESTATTIRTLSAFAANIARHLRPIDGSLYLGEALCVKVIRKQSRGLQDMSEKRRFFAEIQTTWRVY